MSAVSLAPQLPGFKHYKRAVGTLTDGQMTLSQREFAAWESMCADGTVHLPLREYVAEFKRRTVS